MKIQNGNAGKRIYYMKWKNHFFDSNKVRSTETLSEEKQMPMWIFTQWLYCRMIQESITHGGYLMYSEDRPYTSELIARTFHVNKELVELAINDLKFLDMIKIEDGDCIMIPEAVESIGSETNDAERKRKEKERKISEENGKIPQDMEKVRIYTRDRDRDRDRENIHTPISPKGDEETKKEESLKQPMKPMPQPKAEDQPAASGASGAKGFAEPSELESRRNAERPSPAEVVQAGHAISPRVPDDYLTTFINEMKNRDWTYIAAGKTCYVNKRNVQSVLYSFWSNEQKRRTEQAQKKMSHREAVEATQYQHGVYPVNYHFD